MITLDQLKKQHDDKYFDRYRTIVSGDDDIKRPRAKMKNNFLTPEEQVIFWKPYFRNHLTIKFSKFLDRMFAGSSN